MSKYKLKIAECNADYLQNALDSGVETGGVEFPNNIKVYTKKDVICYYRYSDNTTGELNESIYIYDENPLLKAFQCRYSDNYRYQDNEGSYHNLCKCVPFVSIPTDNSFITVQFQTDSDGNTSNYEPPDDFVCIVKNQE